MVLRQKLIRDFTEPSLVFRIFFHHKAGFLHNHEILFELFMDYKPVFLDLS